MRALQKEHLNWIWCLLLQGYFVRPQNATIFCASVFIVGIRPFNLIAWEGDRGWKVCSVEGWLHCFINASSIQ